jgi:surface glycoprotein (TIGR04207 family)/PGF-CTERM protein
MTDNTQQFRAILLAALMVLSVFAGTVAFAGSAAAVDSSGTATVSPDTIDENATQQHTFDVSFTNYSADGTNETLSADAPDGVTVESIDSISATAGGTSLDVTSLGGGTWAIEDPGNVSNATLDINLVATVNAPSVNADTQGDFTFTLEDSAGTDGTAAAQITIQDTDNQTTTNQTAGNQTADNQTTTNQTGTGATGDAEFLSAVHYDTDASSGVQDTVVEVAFSDAVENPSALTLYVDGQPVDLPSSAFSQPTPGQVVIDTGSTLQTGDVVLNVPSEVAQVDENGNNVSVTVASATVDPTVSDVDNPVNVYQGETVALTNDTIDANIEIESDETGYVFSGSTGTNSEVFVFNTTEREIAQYNFTIGDAPNPNAAAELRDLGFNMTIEDQNVTAADAIEGTVTANAGNRPIAVSLLDSDDEEVATIGAALNGQGEYEFEFNLSETDVDPGEYTVRAIDNQSGVTDTSPTINVAEAGEGGTDFNKTIYTEARGDVVMLNVTMENTDVATVTIGSDDVGFRADVTVEDGNDDGVVTLLFDTWAATGVSGDASEVFSTASPEDEILSSDIEIPVSSLLDAGDYDIEVRAGQNDGIAAQSVATLILQERETRSLATWTAPEGTTFEDESEVYEAIANENLTLTESPAYGDLVVQSLNASGLGGVLDAADGEDVAEELFNSSAVAFTVEQTVAETNREPFQLLLNESNTNVIADTQNDTYFIAYNPSQVLAYVDENGNGEFDSNETVATQRFDADESLTANFTVFGDSVLAEDQQTVESAYQLSQPEYEMNEPVNVTASANQTIQGTTSVAPGTQLLIRVRSSGDTSPSFLKTATTYVTENHTYSAQFDFSEQTVNDTFTVTVSGGPSTAEPLEVEGNVVAGGAQGNQTGTATNGTATNGTATNGTATGTATGNATGNATTTAGGQTTTAAPQTGTGAGGETQTGTPGFGITVAIVALVAAALLAVRRD